MTPDATHSQAERLGRQAMRGALAELERKPWTITKFGRHADGYLHARIVVAGRAIYVHRKHGSWMAPVEDGFKEVMPKVAADLQVKARALEKAERTKDDCSTLPQPEQEATDGTNISPEVTDTEDASGSGPRSSAADNGHPRDGVATRHDPISSQGADDATA